MNTRRRIHPKLNASERDPTNPTGPHIPATQKSLTKQAPYESTLVRNIIQRMIDSGDDFKLPEQAHIDCTQLPNFQNMMSTITHLEQGFEFLPARIRANFGNDPSQYAAYLADPANHEDAVNNGLLHVNDLPASDLEADKTAADEKDAAIASAKPSDLAEPPEPPPSSEA